MKIDIIVDTICPWCYVGKKRFEKALAIRPQPDLEVGWRAFQLNPRMPEEGMDRREYVAEKFGGLERANNIHGGLVQAGREEGIEFVAITQTIWSQATSILTRSRYFTRH